MSLTATPANPAHRNAFLDDCPECSARPGFTCAPYCPCSLGVEYFQLDAPDFWVCDCGNDPTDSGLVLVDERGADLTPATEPTWSDGPQCYGCTVCGRYGAQAMPLDDGERVQVLGQAWTLPLGSAA